MREITVRAAQRRDAAELAALNRAFNGATGTCGADEMAALLEEPAEQVLVAVVDGAVAGFICGHVWRSICYSDIQGEIKELYIGSDYRRLGLGQRLMAAMEQYLRGRGVRAVTLFTGLQNTAAQAFYERCGYTDQQQMEYEKKL
ncbi:GNAT family N-acetyltransferase [Neobittarella massiliensis]|nr:GNAT family N-acetyltransferase [Neobittarella massiliensis]